MNRPRTDEFWVTSWTIPDDAPLGIMRYTIDAVDGQRSGSSPPFDVENVLLTSIQLP